MGKSRLYDLLQHSSFAFYPVVPFDPKNDKLLRLDFTAENKDVNLEILSDTDIFCQYLNNLLDEKYRYGIGGYNEHRTIYTRSSVFDTADEPRRLHLGIDIWGTAGTPVFAPLDGYIHSFRNNKEYGDYGATIILQHQIQGISFHTLYGHLSQKDVAGLHKGQYIAGGLQFAEFGVPSENGNWPPHPHFQIVADMHGMTGDYPGVCKYSQRAAYLSNSPDPDTILKMMQYA